jgi:hypothetical protein
MIGIMNLRVLLLVSLILVAGGGVALAADCKETAFGKCYQVRGRYNIYADGDTLWPVGTKRLLETTDDRLDNMLEKAGWEEHSIFGDFVVCPESRYQSGHKQTVCIQSFKNIKLAKRK